jgi:Flp pilus assembly protein TadG
MGAHPDISVPQAQWAVLTYGAAGVQGPRGQRGAVAIMAAVTMVMVLGIAALAVDVSFLLVVRNELQNAADAAALSGAGYLYQGAPLPNWSLASQQATTAIGLNQSLKVTLTDGVINYGYWNATGTPAGLQSLPMTPGAMDLPAVSVTIRKDTGKNGGAVNLLFAKFLGINSMPASATAVAVISSPGYVGPSGLLPIAIASCLYTTYWNTAAIPPAPKNNPTTGLPYVFDIGSAYHYGTCGSGEWTSFDVNSNNVGTINTLITSGNPIGLGIGDNTWIETGTKTALYASINACSAAGDHSCEYVTVPVVANVSTNSAQPIIAFACLHVDLAVGGSGKYVQVEMSTSPKCKTENSGGVGPSYGAQTPPRLVQ